MAEIVLSAFLDVVFEKLASAALKSIARYNGIDAEMKKWQRSLIQIQDVLADASRKEITSQSVKRWLNDLQHLAYDIDDVLDGWLTEASGELTHDSETISSKVRKLLPTCCTNFPQSSRMLAQLDDISSKLQDLVKQKDEFGLRVEGETWPKTNNNNNRRFQSSVVDSSRIVGRQAEKEALLQELLSPADEPCDQNYSIVPIVGMGGVGKTTLARLLYDEKQVKDHFELKAWVCVSDDFDIFAISKVIFQYVASQVKNEYADFNKLQEALRDHVRGKRFLLVIDDIWSESYADWEILVRPLYACAPGSKIIITTRKDQLLKKLGYKDLSLLQSLSHNDAMSLFARHALGVNNFNSHLSLKPYGEGIVKKCDGLPLALIAIGTSLRTKEDEDSWKKVLESEIWKLPVEGEIIPALRLSYHDLSAPLKQLFAYCSLFPKDYLFEKEELVLLWMAEGFLHLPTPSDSTQESLGREYFDELLSRSFFQHAPSNESLFVMHDLMNDLATSVGSEFIVRLEYESQKNIRKGMLEKYRHMSFVREEYVAFKKFEGFERAKGLRTFLATSVGVVDYWQTFYLSNKIMVELLRELPLLRVLSLSNFQISEIPDFIGTLAHLRYLNLSRSLITHLPENVCNLYNLETLILFGCYELNKLPNNFLKLKNLRHLDIRNTPLLKKMPLGMSDLKNLQTLSKIIIEGENLFEIAKLKESKNLFGKTSIVGLEKVENAVHAHEANFSQKRFSELELEWSDELHGSPNEMLEKEVLTELKPHNDTLIQLKIKSYGGLEFPKWVGDPSFLRLKHVLLYNCKRCTSLPPLGQVQSLKELFIEGSGGVKYVGMELLGTVGAFPSLETLSFKQMNGWETWSMNSEDVFPCLKHLYIEDCPNLVEVELKALPLLNVLEIRRCDSGVLRRLVEIAFAVTKLEIRSISGLNDVVWRGVIECLRAVEELIIYCCNEIRYLWESEAVASKVLVNLRKLEVFGCGNLVRLEEKEDDDDDCRSNLLTSLRMLDVYYCNNMERCSCPDSIETLRVLGCPSVTTIFLPTGGQKLKSLTIWDCDKLLETEWKVENMPMLEIVYIRDWANLKSIIKLNYLVHLNSLFIQNCESVESFPWNELLNVTSLKELIITNCPRMDVCGVWPPNLRSLRIGKLKNPISEWGPQSFPTSLVKLYLDGEECSEFSHLLPSSLTDLEINKFEKLESFSMGLQHLTSLQYLQFSNCPNMKKVSHPQHLTSLRHLKFTSCPEMMDLPDVLLPSLLSLTIGYCPKLKERYSKGGSCWPLIYHIPKIHIY